MKVTLITGKPCTGKTTLARAISSQGIRHWFNQFQLEGISRAVPKDAEYVIFDGFDLSQRNCEFIRVISLNNSLTVTEKRNKNIQHFIEPHFIFITQTTKKKVLKSLFRNMNIQIIKCVKLFLL